MTSERLHEETKCTAGFFSSPFLEKGRTFQRFFSLTEEAIYMQWVAHPFSVSKKETLVVSNHISGSTETCFYPSKLVLFSLPHAPSLHQCTLALTLSQPLEGDDFPVRKETGSDSKGSRDWLQQGWSENTVQANVNSGVTIVLMDRL